VTVTVLGVPVLGVSVTVTALSTQARGALRAELPLEVFRVAGVSFEGRQAAVAALQPGAGPRAPA
jgi:hypothetical protein